MSDAYEKTTHGFLINFAEMTVGAPAGEGRFVEKCPKCGRAGVRWRKTLFVHASRYQQLPSGSAIVDHADKCPVPSPGPDKPKVSQTGFSWCPKEWKAV
jgi:hypothetical protein